MRFGALKLGRLKRGSLLECGHSLRIQKRNLNRSLSGRLLPMEVTCGNKTYGRCQDRREHLLNDLVVLCACPLLCLGQRRQAPRLVPESAAGTLEDDQERLREVHLTVSSRRVLLRPTQVYSKLAQGLGCGQEEAEGLLDGTVGLIKQMYACNLFLDAEVSNG